MFLKFTSVRYSLLSTGLSFRTYSGNPCKIFFRKIEFSAKIFEFMTKFPWVCGNFLNFRKNSLLWRHCCFIGVPTFFRNIEFLKNMLEFFEKIAWVLVFLEFLISWVFFENAKRQACSLKATSGIQSRVITECNNIAQLLNFRHLRNIDFLW